MMIVKLLIGLLANIKRLIISKLLLLQVTIATSCTMGTKVTLHACFSHRKNAGATEKMAGVDNSQDIKRLSSKKAS